MSDLEQTLRKYEIIQEKLSSLIEDFQKKYNISNDDMSQFLGIEICHMRENCKAVVFNGFLEKMSIAQQLLNINYESDKSQS